MVLSTQVNQSLPEDKTDTCQSLGSPLYPEWFPQRALGYALSNSAMIVSAEYRVLPESTGADMYYDIRDFQT
jgi:hypothetical protein